MFNFRHLAFWLWCKQIVYGFIIVYHVQSLKPICILRIMDHLSSTNGTCMGNVEPFRVSPHGGEKKYRAWSTKHSERITFSYNSTVFFMQRTRIFAIRDRKHIRTYDEIWVGLGWNMKWRTPENGHAYVARLVTSTVVRRTSYTLFFLYSGLEGFRI
jgi:hypothetical protein